VSIGCGDASIHSLNNDMRIMVYVHLAISTIQNGSGYNMEVFTISATKKNVDFGVSAQQFITCHNPPTALQETWRRGLYLAAGATV
jgi:hypothetical protein